MSAPLRCRHCGANIESPPPPWCWVRTLATITDANGNTVADLSALVNVKPAEMLDDVGNLMAAAPEMLALLKDWQTHARSARNDYWTPGDIFSRLTAVIDLAEGKP